MLALAAFAVSVATAAPKDGPPRCHGRVAEIVGTEEDDVIRGTPERDVIWGGGGDDVIFASLGNDLICGGPGTDEMHGGRGNDEVDGGAGDEDQVNGNLGDDKILGGPGARDEVAGDLGIDIVNGGPGNEDLVHGDYGYDRMSGGAGKWDIASFATARAGGKGSGVWVSLRKHRAFGDGHDKLFGFESLEGSAFRDTLIGSPQANVIDGGPGDDHLVGGGGRDTIDGGQGSDGCEGAKGRTTSCGKEKPPKATAYVELNPTPGGGAGLQVIGGGGRDQFVVAYDDATQTFSVTGKKGMAIGAGCSHAPNSATTVSCPANGPGRWLMADLGPGNDSLVVEGSLESIGSVRLAGGFGNDTIKGGPEDDLIEAGPGADKLYGGDGADGLVGGLPGPTFLYGEGSGDLLAAGGGCAGGAIVGGPGKDDASFAETQAHPGLLIISFPKHAAWVTTVKGCDSVRLDRQQRGHGGLLRLGRPDRRQRPQRDARPARRGPLLRQRRRRHHRRPRRRQGLLDPVRQGLPTEADQGAGQGRQGRNPRSEGHRRTGGTSDHRQLRPQALQLRLRQTRRPSPRPQRLTGFGETSSA